MPNIKLAVFTNQFPAKVNTFFCRDIYSLLQFGFTIDIFPIYPVEEKNWCFVPENYRESFRLLTKLIHISPFSFFQTNSKLKEDISTILQESKKYGNTQFVKSLYVIRQAISWSKRYEGKYNLILSYWGNYAATYGYLANKGCNEEIPFSFFLHAGTDLYRDQIFLEQKIHSAKKIFTVCEFNRLFLQEKYPNLSNTLKNKLIIHHLGIDLDELEFLPTGRDSFTILTIGSMYPQKGYVNVVEAIASLKNEFEQIKLIMIGDGPERKRIWDNAKKLGIEDRITFTGHLPFEEVKKHIRKCTLLIHPSSDLGDAVPTVIKEALASGLPVIGSNIVGIPELLDHGNAGILFPPNDIIALTDAIRTLLLDNDKKTQLVKNGRLFAEEKFDMWRNGKIFAQELASITG